MPEEARGLSAQAGRALLASEGFVVLGPKDASGVIDKIEKCGGDTVRFVLTKSKSADDDERTNLAPNLIGMPMARAIKFASASGFRVKTSGSGTVAKQFPNAGVQLADGSGSSPTLTLFGAEQ